MLKWLMNECIVKFDIIPIGPLLVKGPDVEKNEDEDSEIPDMKFVLIRRNGREEPYLPGGSIKGVIRSQSERIARSLAPSFGCCDPFWTDRVEGKDNKIPNSMKSEISCSDKLGKKGLSSSNVYRLSCPICKLFGNSSLGSRLAVSDAYLTNGFQTKLPYRDGVAIDRFTGGAKGGAKFQYEVLEKGTFSGEIRIRNFELWQLGLMSYVLKDMKDQMIRIGFGKRRGLGKVQGDVKEININYFGNCKPFWNMDENEFEIWGIGKLMGDTGKPYGFENSDVVKIYSKPEFKENGIRTTLKVDLNTLYNGTTKRWNNYIENYQLPDEMTFKKEEVENAADIQY